VLKRRNYKRNYIRTESDAENPTCQTNTAKSYVVSSSPDKSFITNSLHAIHTILSDPAYYVKKFPFPFNDYIPNCTTIEHRHTFHGYIRRTDIINLCCTV